MKTWTWSYSGPSGEIRLIEQPRGVFQVKRDGERGEDIAKVNTQMHLTLGLLQYFSAMLEFVSSEGGNQLLSPLHNEISQQKMKN